LLPERSVETFYLLFPDPWPKRRHHRRRLVTNDFFDSIHRALTSDGSFLIATDQLDYFQQIQRVAASDSRFRKIDIEREAPLPSTKFERRFRDQGVSIYRLSLRKISPVR
jgi:tRNA (guanine-N7-)-methyltransferase